MNQRQENQKEKETNQQSNVAWYKLAELINRGEKEKALSFYRLLSHSFDDRSYALQLEGDMLWAFEDNDALQKYRQAAFLYQKENKLVSAVCVYEHLLTLEPNDYDFLASAILFYTELDWPEKFSYRFVDLINLHEEQKTSDEFISDLVKKILELSKQSEHRNKWVLIELKKIIKIMPENLAEVIQDCL